MFKRLALAITFLFFAGCSLHNSNPMNLDTGTVEVIPVLQADQLSYKLVQEKILSKRCVACHSEAAGNKGDVNLETYENVFAAKAQIRAEVFSGSMPPASRPQLKLSANEIKVLLDWIDNGAKKEATDSTPVVVPPATSPVIEPLPPVVSPPVVAPPVVTEPPVITEPVGDTQVYFAEVMAKVIQTNCLKCHSEKAGNRGGINLETYASVFENRFELKDDVEQGVMPPRPPRGTALTDGQKSLILEWLAKGAPEKAP